MTKFDEIYEIAADNHGLISSAQARDIGVSNNELVQYARRGRVMKVGHGLYKLARWVPELNDCYAWAVMMVGPNALLYGESVIEMLDLAPTNPDRTYVATPSRCRRKLPKSFVVKQVDGIVPSAVYDGIPCQSVFDAIDACRGKMMRERLLCAAENARREGYLLKAEYDGIVQRICDD